MTTFAELGYWLVAPASTTTARSDPLADGGHGGPVPGSGRGPTFASDVDRRCGARRADSPRPGVDPVARRRGSATASSGAIVLERAVGADLAAVVGLPVCAPGDRPPPGRPRRQGKVLVALGTADPFIPVRGAALGRGGDRTRRGSTGACTLRRDRAQLSPAPGHDRRRAPGFAYDSGRPALLTGDARRCSTRSSRTGGQAVAVGPCRRNGAARYSDAPAGDSRASCVPSRCGSTPALDRSGECAAGVRARVNAEQQLVTTGPPVGVPVGPWSPAPVHTGPAWTSQGSRADRRDHAPDAPARSRRALVVRHRRGASSRLLARARRPPIVALRPDTHWRSPTRPRRSATARPSRPRPSSGPGPTAPERPTQSTNCWWSGCRDLNPGPQRPERCALTKLRYIP